MYRRAQEIVELADRPQKEMTADEDIAGDVHIAAAQSAAMRIVARAMTRLRHKHPQVRVRLHDDYGQNIIERLDNGLADFGVLVQPTDMSRYDFLPLPTGDPMGLLMRYDHPLATRESIHPKDLADVPVIVPQGVLNRRDLSGWYKSGNKELNIVGTMNLLYNASCFVQEGYGCAICLQGLVDTSWESGLVFQPLDPPMQTHLAIAWKKSQPPTPAADAFLTEFRSVIADINRDNKESVPSPRNGAQR